MVWLLQPKDFVYGQSYARLSYRIFYTENSEKTIFGYCKTTLLPPAKFSKKLELEKTFFHYYTNSKL